MNLKGLLLPAAVLVFLMPACDIFQTREPEPPSQSTSSFEPPVTPEIVLRNIQSAIRENNVDNYLRCFVDTAVTSYAFFPSQDVSANFGVWTLEDERRYFRSIGTGIDGTPFLTISLQNTTFYSDSTYTMNYSLFFPHKDANAPKFVKGNMQLHLAVDMQGRWAVNEWRDNKLSGTSDSTWSYFKFWFNK